MKLPRFLSRLAERRDWGSRHPYVAEMLGVLRTASGASVSAATAENLSTVLACVNTIGSAIASLPVYVYRRDGKARIEDPAHPMARLIRVGPNAQQTWPDFIEWAMASALHRGNALAEIVTDNAGMLAELRPIPWETVHVKMLPSGRLAYMVSPITSIHGATRAPRHLLDTEVVHLRDRSDDGLVGRSRLSRAAETIGTAVAVQSYVNHVYSNGAYPSGTIEVPHKLGDTSMRQLSTQFREAFAGSRNAAKALILEQGVKWTSLGGVTPEDAELLAARRFTTEELARIYNVPPPLVGIWDHSSFTNSETAGRWFAQFTLSPWLKKIEAVLARSTFTESERATHEIEFDLSAFMRGDYAARWAAHKIAVDGRILTPNEVREVEGWNPRPDGDNTAPASTAA